MNAFTIENFRLTAALSYARRGWQIIPIHYPVLGSIRTKCSCPHDDCGSPGKHPMTANGLKDCTVDEAQIRAWWKRNPSANIGIVTGAISRLFVLDIDADKGGLVTLAEIIDQHGELPQTPCVETGGGGMHYFFKHPGVEVKNTTGKIGKGIDTRGDGGYVVAAPSLHVSENRYDWRLPPEECELADMPPWMLKVVTERPQPVQHDVRIEDDAAQHWLGKALARCGNGNRNNTGFWLATQLRDAGVARGEAERTIRDYAARAPRGDEPYTEREAVASFLSAYQTPARAPAKSASAPRRVAVPPKPPPAGASGELKKYLADVAGGKIVNVPWPWPMLTNLTQALIPGTTTTVCGDPGVGKTFFVLQCVMFWNANGFDPAVLFVEKNRRFHMMRLLAQLEGNGRFVNHDELQGQHDEIEAAMLRNAEMIDEIGKCVYGADGERQTLDSALGWLRQMASAGKRVVVIDPVTALDAGKERWTADDDFMLAAEQVCASHDASLVLVTHPKKGNRPGSPTGHDQAAGAAYHRFADTNIWIHLPKKIRKCQVRSKHGFFVMKPKILFQLHKTRNGRGAGTELAFTFGDGLRFSEQGLVTKELKESEESEVEQESPV